MPDDWAQTTADEIIADLCDRRGLRQAFEEIDAGIQEEIRAAWAQIVRKVFRSDGPKP